MMRVRHHNLQSSRYDCRWPDESTAGEYDLYVSDFRLCLMVQNRSMLMINPNSWNREETRFITPFFEAIRMECWVAVTWRKAITTATMPTTWSFWISASWRALRQPLFHQRSGLCFLRKQWESVETDLRGKVEKIYWINGVKLGWFVNVIDTILFSDF